MEPVRRVHQTYGSKELPWIYERILEKNKAMSPMWEFRMWTDEELRAWIAEKDPRFLPIFNRCLVGVQRGDLARLLLLYYEGGLYIDLDIECLDDLDKLWAPANKLDPNKFLVTTEPKEQIEFLYGQGFYICNAMMYSPKDHPMLKRILDYILELSQVQYGVFNVFGANLFNRFLGFYKDSVQLLAPKYIYPINDLKLKRLSSFSRDLERLRNGQFPEAVMVHYWIHGSFESRRRLEEFQGDKNKPIHTLIYEFLQPLYNL